MIYMREIFDSPVSYRVLTHSPIKFEVYFKIGKIGYTFDASADEDDKANRRNFWIVFSSHTTLRRDWGSGKMHVTGEGNPFVVFSTLAKIMEEFIKKYKPYQIQFSADEKSRQKVYRIFAQMIGKKFNYMVKILHWSMSGEEYIFIKKGVKK